MALCSCSERPRCMAIGCDDPADWTIVRPLGRHRAMFICNEDYEAMRDPIPGIDRPDSADENWRPSLFDMVRQSSGITGVVLTTEQLLRKCIRRCESPAMLEMLMAELGRVVNGTN